MAAERAPLRIGQRVADKNGFIGTVRYLGPVPTSKKADTVYAGVEWDDPTRGKHDGSVEKDGATVRLFTCEAGRGSFMKLPLLSHGVSMVQALVEKYEGEKLDGMESVGTTSGGFMEVEFVGEDHIRNKQRLLRNQSVSLKDSMVGSIDADGVGAHAPNIQELDMRGNLLWCWDDVVTLGKQLAHLQVLNLGSNQMCPMPASVAPSLSAAFKGLRVLILSNTGMSWAEAALAARSTPCLEELHVCQNNLTRLDGGDMRVEGADTGATPPAGDAATGAGAAGAGAGSAPAAAGATSEVVAGLPHLRVLNLAENRISSWAEVARLGRLPRLEHLLLHHNLLEDVVYAADGAGATDGEAERPFAALKSVDMSDNRINDWVSVSQLSLFPRLDNVRIQRNPLFGTLGPAVARQLLVARLPSVTRLNQSEVRTRERADAEKGYLRRVSAEFHEAEGVDLFAKFTAAREAAAGPEEVQTGAGGGAGAGGGVSTSADVGLARAVIESTLSPETRAKLDKDHPRFLELLGRHGAEMIAIIKATGSSMASNSATVTLKSMAASSCTVEPIKRKLPLSMTIASLKTLMARAFKCEPALQHLAYRSKGAYPSPLDNDMQTLSFYGFADGGEVLLEEIDPEAVRRAEELEEAERKQREEKQLASVEATLAAQMADVNARRTAAAQGAGQ